ncbi:MAG TPA: MFS transporter [Rectinemataceae bacterium]|nr:MFS transporter [Rectinemataceae bacterium]
MIPKIGGRSGLLANRDFMLLFSGKLVSQLGDQVYAFALSWFILARTHSGLQMALFLVVDSLVLALLSPLGGAIADRTSRKSILVAMDLARALIVIALAILYQFDVLQIWMLYVGAVALSTCAAVFGPASSAIIPNIVDDKGLPKALSLVQFSWSFTAIAGMLAGGIVFSWAGVSAIFLINALSFLVSAGLEARVRVAARLKSLDGSRLPLGPSLRSRIGILGREMREGYHYVRSDRLIFSFCVLYAIYNALIMPMGFVYIPYFFNAILKAASYQLAFATGSIFVGMMTASLIVPRVIGRLRLRSAILRGLFVLGASWAVFIASVLGPLGRGLDTWGITWLVSGLSFAIGLAVTFFNVPINLILQRRTADEYRGRFWGFFSSLVSLSVPFGYLVGGALVQRLPLRLIFAASALAVLALALWIAGLKELRELED